MCPRIKNARSIEKNTSEWTTLSMDGPIWWSPLQMIFEDVCDETISESISPSLICRNRSHFRIDEQCRVSWVDWALSKHASSQTIPRCWSHRNNSFARSLFPNLSVMSELSTADAHSPWMHTKQMAILLSAMSCRCSPGVTADECSLWTLPSWVECWDGWVDDDAMMSWTRHCGGCSGSDLDLIRDALHQTSQSHIGRQMLQGWTSNQLGLEYARIYSVNSPQITWVQHGWIAYTSQIASNITKILLILAHSYLYI